MESFSPDAQERIVDYARLLNRLDEASRIADKMHDTDVRSSITAVEESVTSKFVDFTKTIAKIEEGESS